MTDYRPTTVSSMYRAAIAEPRHSLRAVSRGSDSGPLSTLGFVLFILINATLFIRPAELLISLEGWPIYEVLIILCMLVSLPSLVAEMSLSSLKRWPISL